MSQKVVSQTTSSDGQWVITTYDDGTTSVAATAGSTLAVQQANLQSLQTKAQQALTNNTTFIGQAKPSTAANQASQAYDQTVALSRQVDGVIRLLLGLLDSTAGT